MKVGHLGKHFETKHGISNFRDYLKVKPDKSGKEKTAKKKGRKPKDMALKIHNIDKASNADIQEIQLGVGVEPGIAKSGPVTCEVCNKYHCSELLILF